MASEPTYLEIADGLVSQLGTSGDRVISENELAQREGVSRPTARAALQELERRFLVRRVRGAGTFVNERFDYVISSEFAPSASATLRRAGAQVSSEVLEISIQRPAADVAYLLDIDRSEKILVLKRIFRIGSAVAAYSTSHLPYRLVPGLEHDFESGESLFLALSGRFGLSPQRAWSRASLELPRDPIAEILQMEGKPPTWLLEGGVHDLREPSQMLEFSRSWMRVDLINVVYEMGPAPEFIR
jgi:DNA-binding GntR family transcriptional regulator